MFAFSSGPATSVSASDIIGALSPVTTQFSLTNVLAVITAILGITVVLAFAWWGVRLAYNRITSAAMGGSGSVGGRRRRR